MSTRPRIGTLSNVMFGIISTAFLASAVKQLFVEQGNYNFNTILVNEKKKKYSRNYAEKKNIHILIEVIMFPEFRNMNNKGPLADSRKTEVIFLSVY